MELKDINGIGKVRLGKFESNNIKSVTDLLNYYPYKYYNFTATCAFNKSNKLPVTIKTTVVGNAKAVFFGGKSYTICKMEDNAGNDFNAVWFNQPFMKNNLLEGNVYFLYGAVNNKNQFVVQKSFRAEKTETNIVPVYKSLDGIPSGVIRNCVNSVLTQEGAVRSVIPECIEAENGLESLYGAYRNIHLAEDTEKIEPAKERVGLETLILLAALEASVLRTHAIKPYSYTATNIADFEAMANLTLTQSQKSAIQECFSDMDNKECMNRLVLGDVGSGKTMVAFACAQKVMASGGQTILLCPTEILATQHFHNALKIWKDGEVELLIGSTPGAEGRRIKESLVSGKTKLLISTHACLSDNVQVPNLMLVITDEQHRFGVGQRAKLSNKGNAVDTIIMSATPIPRSLSLVLFGGLKVSELKERPNGESKIKTNIVSMQKVKDMWNFIADNIANKNAKVMVVVPRINSDNDSEGSQLISVYDAEKEIKDTGLFDSDTIGVMHGKMKSEEKDCIMEQFKHGAVKVLVSTTVIEVGVDVKDANIMVVYNADNFGLATLHQLRGRVGRDGREGYCFCVVGAVSDVTAKRLRVFKENNNGLKIAEEDLKLRGAGTLYGTSQHGYNELYSVAGFSVDGYNKAKEIFNKLPKADKEQIAQIAESKFGEMYKNIVFN